MMLMEMRSKREAILISSMMPMETRLKTRFYARDMMDGKAFGLGFSSIYADLGKQIDN